MKNNLFLFIVCGLCLACCNDNTTKDFSEVLNTALATGEKNINIPRGKYYLDLSNGNPFILEGLNNLTINLNGSEIIASKGSQVLSISDCENLKLSGFSIDCDTLPFSQGTIVDLDADNRMWIEFKIMEGYPIGSLVSKIPERIQIFDKKTQNLKHNLYTYWNSDFASITQTGERQFRLLKKNFNPDSNESIGDYIVMSLPDGANTRPHSIVISKSKNIHLEDITIYSGNCFGFFEDQCESNVYNRCKVTKKTDDIRVAFPRLRSINADAFHSKGAIVGPTITNCVFQYHGDDCIAINTSFYKIVACNDESIDIAVNGKNIKMRPGDRLKLADYSGKVIGEGKLTKFEDIGKFEDSNTERRRRANNRFKLFLDKPMKDCVGGVVYSLDMGGAGFVIKDNVMGYTRARGILVKASDGIISGNTVIGCELSGIILSPELSWMEAGFSDNVQIVDNTIIDCMFANSSYGIEQAAPISVVAINWQEEIVPPGGFKNIIIKNNTIKNTPVPAMIIASVEGGIVENNKIEISKDVIREHGKKLKIDSKDAIWTKNNTNVLFENNIIE